MANTPDQIVFFTWKFVTINGTLVFSWIVMAILLILGLLATRNLRTGREISRLQNGLEIIVRALRNEVKSLAGRESVTYVSFIGTLFLFISLSNLLSPVPFYQPPTSSISVTAALAIAVFVAVPVYGIAERGVGGYLRHYIEPSPVMLPFTIISELSRTLALAIRLFGNILSGTMIVGVLLSLAPLVIPLIMEVFGLLIGQIQAYIFAALAAVYIGSAIRVQDRAQQNNNPEKE
jgi:F-type H+-transporting ATPase subunit a